MINLDGRTVNTKVIYLVFFFYFNRITEFVLICREKKKKGKNLKISVDMFARFIVNGYNLFPVHPADQKVPLSLSKCIQL